MKSIELFSSAWHGDKPVILDFPDDWEISLIGNQALPQLSLEQIRQRILSPIGSPPLSEIAAGRRRAAILLDDLSRPTPGAELLSVVLEELNKAGISHDRTVVLIATGTHAPASEAEMCMKVGQHFPEDIRLISHDCRHSLAHLGRSQHGAPVWVNQTVMECDLKIGIGCLYPHPAAGFSGGAKALIPGLAGFETIRFLHDHLQGAERRGGDIDNEFRRECEQIASQIGLDFIINVALNQARQITDVFAGDMHQAFRQGVEAVRCTHSVPPQPDADIVLVDMYPFDADLQFAYDRGLWPLDYAGRQAARVILASCPNGVGSHDLFPLKNSFTTRLVRRLSHFRLRDLSTLAYRLSAARRLIERKNLQVKFVSEGLTEAMIRPVFPSGMLFPDWPRALVELKVSSGGRPQKAALYRSAPLMLPSDTDLKLQGE